MLFQITDLENLELTRIHLSISATINIEEKISNPQKCIRLRVPVYTNLTFSAPFYDSNYELCHNLTSVQRLLQSIGNA